MIEYADVALSLRHSARLCAANLLDPRYLGKNLQSYFDQDGQTEASREILGAFRCLPDDLINELRQLPRSVPKCLVIDRGLIDSLDVMLKTSDLKEFRIEKVFRLEGSIPPEWKYIFYLVPAAVAAVRTVIEHIKKDKVMNVERSYTVGFVPKVNVAMETMLEREGCLGHRVRIADFRLSCIPIDLDLVTLNCPQLFRSVFIDRSREYLEIFADSLLRLLTKMGVPWGDIRGRLVIGEASKKIVHLLDSNIIKAAGDSSANRLAVNHTITLALMDRDLDLVTPQLSQLIYEGRLDDHFGIKLGRMAIDADVIEEDKGAVMLLDWKDAVFADVRHLEPSTLAEEMRKKLVENREASEKGRNLRSVKDMSRFVRDDLRDLRQTSMLLSRHVNISTHINRDTPEQVRVVKHERALLDGISDGLQELLEEQLTLREGLMSSMRLLSLWCLTHDGLPKATYDSMVQLACQAYGYDTMLAFYNLRRAGLLYPKQQKGVWPIQGRSFSQLRKYLELCCPAQADSPNTPYKSGESYVFMGHHTPVIARLVERVFACSNKFKPEWLKGVPLAHVDYTAPIRYRGRQIIVIGFVGGCTLSEVNALRLLANHYNIQIVVVTSCTLNSRSLIEQLQSGV